LNFACGFAIFISFLRLIQYRAGFAATLSLLGRLRTARWILPRFDIVYVAPLLIWLLVLTVVSIEMLTDLPLSVLAAILSGGATFISLACPPGLEKWKLTGSHRIVPGLSALHSHFVQTQ
jgi:hypothetical protein